MKYNINKITKMKEGGAILAKVITLAKEICVPGISTKTIDDYIEKKILSYGAVPSFKNFKGYKFSSCISINEELVHTPPSNKIIKIGDIVSIDTGVYYKGYHTDCAITFGIRKITQSANNLIQTTKKSLINAIKNIKPGIHIGNIQWIIQKTIEDNNFYVIKDLSGHGIGKNLQEEPTISNYGYPNTGFILKEGMTFCIEPMAAIGTSKIITKPDKWTICSADNSLTAHFEHTIAVERNGALVLTSID